MSDIDDLEWLEAELGPRLQLMLRRAASEISADAPPQTSRGAVRERGLLDVEEIILDVDAPQTEPSALRRHPRRLAIAATAAAIVLAILAVLVSSNRNESAPANEPTDPRVMVGRIFLDAWQRGDGAEVSSLFASGGRFEEFQTDVLPRMHDWLRAAGWRYRDRGCELRGADSQVVCSYALENRLARVVEDGPVTGEFALTVNDGRAIEVARDELDADDYDRTVRLFADWVRAAHPDDFSRMFTPDAAWPQWDSPSAELWNRYLDEFVAEGDAYVNRAELICGAAQASLADALSEAGTTGSTPSLADVEEAALTELRSVPAPLIVRERFERDYGFIERRVQRSRGIALPDDPALPASYVVHPSLAGCATGGALVASDVAHGP